MRYIDFAQDFKDYTLCVRRLGHVITTERFRAAYGSKSVDEWHEVIDGALQSREVGRVLDVIRDIERECLEANNIRELREMAKSKRIQGWSRMSKYELLMAISAAQKG